MNMKKIAELRPTQVTHGEREVRQKTEAYRALSPHDLEMAIAEKPIPIVLGPAAQSYAIDHHHVATALWHVGIKKVPVVLVSDLSSLTRAEFWLTMENKPVDLSVRSRGPKGRVRGHVRARLATGGRRIPQSLRFRA
jgi:hypothetical protein